VIDHLGQYPRGRHVWVVRRAESAP
jgi:hypothetical protein